MARVTVGQVSRGNHTEHHPEISDLIDALAHDEFIVAEGSAEQGYVAIAPLNSTKKFWFQKNAEGYQLTILEKEHE